MGNSFVLFDVSIVISRGQFHCGNIGHTQNTDSPWVNSYFPVGKSSSGTATIELVLQILFHLWQAFTFYVDHVSILGSTTSIV